MTSSGVEYPTPPAEFGRDGGEFYRHYDKIADQLDNGMIKGLKSNLDGLLIFAGLFAGINSAFLALTLPKMNADPSDDTNALLQQLVQGGNNTAFKLPSSNFSPNAHISVVNFLFLVSLASALFASFFAVVGKQWLAYYQTPDGSGGDKERGEQLKRSQGVERWRLMPILDGVIPLLLQFALVIFSVGIVLYLKTLSTALAYTMMGLLIFAALCFCVTIGVSFWDPYSPYRTPASQFFNWVCDKSVFVLMYMVVLVSRGVEDAFDTRLQTAGDRDKPLKIAAKTVGEEWMWKLPLQRKADPPTQLQADFIRRILAVSADREAVFQAALNMLVVRNSRTIERIVEDDLAVGQLRSLFMDLDLRGFMQDGSRQLPFAMGREAVVLGGAVLQLDLYNPSESGTQATDWSPEAIFESPTGLGHLLEVRSQVDQSASIPLPASYSIMMWLWKAWSKNRSPAELLVFPNPTHLSPSQPLQTTAFLAFSLVASLKLETADPSTTTFSSWSYSLFPIVHNAFWKQDIEDHTELISDALGTSTRDRKPPPMVYIALLRGITVQIKQTRPKDDALYLFPVIRATCDVWLSQEGRGNELDFALRSAALSTIGAGLEYAITALRLNPDAEAIARHTLLIRYTILVCQEYLDVLMDEKRNGQPEDVEELRLLEPIMTLLGRSGVQDERSQGLITSLTEKYNAAKRSAERSMQMARLVSRW